jgi:hypothetical protein
MRLYGFSAQPVFLFPTPPSCSPKKKRCARDAREITNFLVRQREQRRCCGKIVGELLPCFPFQVLCRIKFFWKT